jgi:hypothetical protein
VTAAVYGGTYLDKIDISVLEDIVTESYRTLTAGTYDLRARERAATPPNE